MPDLNVSETLTAAEKLLETSPKDALIPLRKVLGARPGDRTAQRLLRDALRAIGDPRWEQKARELAAAAELDHPDLARASNLISEGNLSDAQSILKERLEREGEDARALRLLATVAMKQGRRGAAERLLVKAVNLAPDFESARYELALALYMASTIEALEHIDRLLADAPHSIEYMKLKAAVLGRLGRYSEGARLYRLILAQDPQDQASWIMYGHALRVENHVTEAISAYREAISINPSLGSAWWSLANIKTVKLDDSDIDKMSASVDQPDLAPTDRMPLHFALGKAFEDKGRAPDAFEHYRRGNALAAMAYPYSAEKVDQLVAHSKQAVIQDLLARPRGSKSKDASPIFVLGMPRAGSTLVEQILSSHSQVEPTWEMPHVIMLSRAIEADPKSGPYPENLRELSDGQTESLGQRYLDWSRVDRPQGRAFFIDKNPNNWMHVGLIRMMLPDAKIVDIRRHPLDCGFSNFRQLFARGHEFSYSLEAIGHYYARYVELMAHWDSVVPGLVHRVRYERLVEHPEQEIRALLDYLGLGFEEACLRPHETKRAIRTPSSEQVQRPINSAGIGQWQAFDQWLDPLRDSLGPVLTNYPDVPTEFLGK